MNNEIIDVDSKNTRSQTDTKYIDQNMIIKKNDICIYMLMSRFPRNGEIHVKTITDEEMI